MQCMISFRFYITIKVKEFLQSRCESDKEKNLARRGFSLWLGRMEKRRVAESSERGHDTHMEVSRSLSVSQACIDRSHKRKNGLPQ